MPRLHPSRPATLLALACALFTGLLQATPAAALEHVTLRNQFTYDCARTEPRPDGHLRLYFSLSSGNFIDLPSDNIASIEHLPDPPPAPVAATQPASSAEPSSEDVSTLLARAGEQHHIDVALLASLVDTESRGHRKAVSRAGAQGLMQLMPATARDLGVQDPFRADQNIAGGAAYLDALLTRYNNNLQLALAAYNAGPAAVDKYHGIPPYRETRAYVSRVEREFIRRKRLAAAQPAPAASLAESAEATAPSAPPAEAAAR